MNFLHTLPSLFLSIFLHHPQKQNHSYTFPRPGAMNIFACGLLIAIIGSLPLLSAETPNTKSGADFLVTHSKHTGDSPKHFQNLIHRELVRQALVLSALHYADYLPEDIVMDRMTSGDDFMGPRFQVEADLSTDHVFSFGVLLLSDHEETRFQKKALLPESTRFGGIVSEIAASIPEELADYLTDAIGAEHKTKRVFPVPDLDVDDLQWRMNPLDQFQVLRYWHARASQEGLTEDILRGLVMGYANLGQLTRHAWNTFPFAATARSLLYGDLLLQLHGDTDSVRATRAYAFTLGTYLQYAQLDFEAINGDPDPLLSTLMSFYKYDLETLRPEPASSLPHAPLSALLGMLSVENYFSGNYVTRIVDELIQYTPGNVRGMEISNKEVGVSRLHFSTREGPRMTQELFQGGFRRMTDLPPDLARVIHPALTNRADSASSLESSMLRFLGLSPVPPRGFTDEIYRDVYQAAYARPFAADGYPCWRVLAKTFWDTHFYNAVTRLHFMAVNWNVGTGNTLREMLPGFEGHPLKNVLESYDDSLSNEETRVVLESVTLRDSVPPMHLFLRRWARSRAEHFADQSVENALRDLFRGSHMDVLRTTEMRRYLSTRNRNEVAENLLERETPYHPRALADRVQYGSEWEEAKAEADRRQPGHPIIAGAYGFRLRREGMPEKAIPYFEQAAQEVGGRMYFVHLSEIYLNQGNEDKWLETRLAFTESYDTGLGRSRTFEEIAYHFMSTSRPERALPFSERAAASYSARGLRTAALNHTLLGNREETKAYQEAIEKRYGPRLYREIWFSLICDVGDPEHLIETLREEPFGVLRNARKKFQLGLLDESAEDLVHVYETRKDNYELLMAALIELKQGREKQARELLKRVETDYEAYSEKIDSRETNLKLSRLFLQALDTEWDGKEILTRAEAIRTELIPPHRDYNQDLQFFTGFYLLARGEHELAEEHLKEAMHLDDGRLSHRLIARTLRLMGLNPLEKFQSNPED